jgi:hypothetical protein
MPAFFVHSPYAAKYCGFDRSMPLSRSSRGSSAKRRW